MTAAHPDFATTRVDLAIAVFRGVTALLFIQHGLQKLFGFPAPSQWGVAPLLSFMGFAGALELVGGGLVLVGLFARPAAFILAGEMAFGYFIAHAGQGFFPILNGGELAILFCFAFLLLSATGPGAFSIDGLRRASSKA